MRHFRESTQLRPEVFVNSLVLLTFKDGWLLINEPQHLTKSDPRIGVIKLIRHSTQTKFSQTDKTLRNMLRFMLNLFIVVLLLIDFNIGKKYMKKLYKGSLQKKNWIFYDIVSKGG